MSNQSPAKYSEKKSIDPYQIDPVELESEVRIQKFEVFIYVQCTFCILHVQNVHVNVPNMHQFETCQRSTISFTIRPMSAVRVIKILE